MKGRRYRSREPLKATLFCHQKINEKADMLCMKFSSTSNTSVQQVSQLQISKSMLHYSVAPSPSKNISMINEMENEQFQLPFWSFRIKLKYTSSLVATDPIGLYVSEYLLNFILNQHNQLIKEKLSIYGIQITRKCNCVSKNSI